MNSGYSKTSDPHRLLLNISVEISLNIYYSWKNIKNVIQKQ